MEVHRRLRFALLCTVYILSLASNDHTVIASTEILDDCFNNPVGVADNSTIPDDHMTSPSVVDPAIDQPYFGRLNGSRENGWCGAASNDPWLQVDLGKLFAVCGVATQGAVVHNEWTTHFKLNYSTDGNIWTTYKDENETEELVREGGKTGVDQHKLAAPVSARFIRFLPAQFVTHRCLRVEVYMITCPALPAPSSGKIFGCPGNATMYNDTVCQFSCNNGYIGSGSQVRRCQHNGTWSGQDFTCQRIVCEPLQLLPNLRMNSSCTRLPGDSCKFTCERGYNLIGSNIRQCNSDGSWTGTQPRCEVITCPALPAPSNGIRFGCSRSATEYDYDTVCQFACKSGYIGSGSKARRCQHNGTWSGQEFTCQMAVCRNYKVLSGADRTVGKVLRSISRCDGWDLVPGWYRFQGAAGDRMADKCVPKYRCGTHATGWLNGTHPTVAEGVVTRKVCYHWAQSCCYRSRNINVKSCGAFYVYELRRTPGCYARYCGNGGQ